MRVCTHVRVCMYTRLYMYRVWVWGCGGGVRMCVLQVNYKSSVETPYFL